MVLLPEHFPEWEPRVQAAVLCHELLHVRRRDWLFTVAEELIRTLLWFHPAVWWLLGQIQLAREQAVDREVVRRTRQRDDYVDTLLWIAGANPRPDLAPAPLFLRKRHLKQRVVSILEEVRMSRTRIVTSLAAALGIVAAACWLAAAAFPLAAAPQSDAPGVTVTLHGAAVLHRAPVLYPPAALAKGVQGTVTLDATLDASGEVTDARVLSGPQELRAAALQSVLQWHFQGDGTAGTRQVSVDFHLPPGASGAAAGSAAWPAPASAAVAGLLLRNISIEGMPQAAADELRSRLPLHEGDTLAADSIQQMGQALAEFDRHLKMVVRLGYRGVTDPRGAHVEKQVSISISPASSLPPAPVRRSQAAAESRLRVGGNAQATKLVFQVTPVYPPRAKQARVQGTVRLGAVIGKDGAVRNISVLSGDPALATSAVDAVKQWIYAPTLLNGQAVEVATEIDVNYTLSR